MAYITTQAYQIVNDAFDEFTGQAPGTTKLDSTNIATLGKSLSDFQALDGFWGKIAHRIIKTVMFAKNYSAETRKILRDEHSYGAFIQKLYFIAPDAVENPTYKIPDGNGDYKQLSPYAVEGTVGVESRIYGNDGTWSYEFVMPTRQLSKAVLNVGELNAIIDGAFVAVRNKIEGAKESLINLAANTSAAKVIADGRAINLLADYNDTHSTPLTVAEALESLAFLKYASKRISKTVDFMKKQSVNYNGEKYLTFTDAADMVVEVNSDAAQSFASYLEADTFHKELVSLPGYTTVPFWQFNNEDFDLNSAIDIKNDQILSGTEIAVSGIIAMIRDIDNVAAYFGDEYEWRKPNERDRVSIHGYQYEKGFGVDNFAQSVVFYIAEGGSITKDTTDAHVTSISTSKPSVSVFQPIQITAVFGTGYTYNAVTVNGTAITPNDDGEYWYVPATADDITIVVTSKSA